MRTIFAGCCYLLMLSVSAANGGEFSPADEIIKVAEIKAGLVVHLGCANDKLTAALSKSGNFSVHGISPDDATVEKARSNILASGLYGKRVSVERCSFSSLPYADNLVNLIVIDDAAAALQKGLKLPELFRVLRPNGVLLALGMDKTKAEASKFKDITVVNIGSSEWLRAVKPVPEGIGDWSHWRCTPGDNPVSTDKVAGIPQQMQWLADPRTTRGHKPGTVAVAANGCVVFTHDETFTMFPGEKLPKDANMSLVARDGYNGLLLWKKAIPKIGLYTLVVHGDFVYTRLTRGGPCVKLDVITGKTILTYEKTNGCSTIRYIDGILILTVASENRSTKTVAFNAESGNALWQNKGGAIRADNGNVFIKNSAGVINLNLKTGAERWKKTEESWTKKTATFSATALDLLVLMTRRARSDCLLHVVDANDGKLLWEKQLKIANGYRPIQQIFFVRDLLYANCRDKNKKIVWLGMSPRTGEEKSSFLGARGGGGGTCVTETASQNFFFKGDRIVDITTQKARTFGTFRSGCKPGTVPANGMTYIFPADCTCAPSIKGTGGFVSDITLPPDLKPTDRHIKGIPAPAIKASGKDDWQSPFHDSARSGATTSEVPDGSKLLWTVDLGSQPTAASVAWGLAFIGTKAHRVIALDAATGKEKWNFTAGGAIETSPTLYEGLCLFGSNDGWVYCLDASSGKLVWRLHATPKARKICVFEQLESAWPVNSGITIFKGAAYFFAGRMKRPGGYHTVRVEPRTGTILWETSNGGNSSCPMLIAGGAQLYFANYHKRKGPGGILRLNPKDGKITFLKHFKGVPKSVYTAGPSTETHSKMRRWVLPGLGHRGSAERLVFTTDMIFAATWEGYKKRSPTLFAKGEKPWSVKTPIIHTEAMILAGKTLFLAGVNNKNEGELRSFSSLDGTQVDVWKLDAQPVPNGLSAATGRLYLPTSDGKIHCFGK